MKRVDEMRILVVSLLYPLPGNVFVATFVADHVADCRVTVTKFV